MTEEETYNSPIKYYDNITEDWKNIPLVIDTDIDTKEDISNKVTSINNSSTNTQYPSAKAVYDLFNSIIDFDEELY